MAYPIAEIRFENKQVMKLPTIKQDYNLAAHIINFVCVLLLLLLLLRIAV